MTGSSQHGHRLGPGSRLLLGALRSRRASRFPILLYRAHLGILLGSRFLLLEHRGRKSGEPRLTVLEVIDRSQPGRYVVVSGFGERSQWLRNVQVDPRVRIRTGGGQPRRASARRLDPEQSARMLTRYIDRNPRAWKTLEPVLGEILGHSVTDGRELVMVEFVTAH